MVITFLDESCEIKRVGSHGMSPSGKMTKPTWETFARVSCKWDPRRRSSEEEVGIGKRTGVERGAFFTSYVEGVTSDMRIFYKGDTYQIDGPPNKMIRFGVGHHLEIYVYKVENV